MALTVSIKDNFPEVQRRLASIGRQMPFALRNALNKTAQWVDTEERREMRRVFDRPTPYFLRSLRIVYASKTKLEARVWFKNISLGESASKRVIPHVEGGRRSFKPFEARLRAIGALPPGWFAVPGKGAKLNAYGNMSAGQISAIINFVGSFTEAGFNTSNPVSRARLKKKKGVAYFVAKPGNPQRLPPGIYKSTATRLGSALQSMLHFVPAAQYRKRFDFFGIGQATVRHRFPGEADAAIRHALATAR